MKINMTNWLKLTPKERRGAMLLFHGREPEDLSIVRESEDSNKYRVMDGMITRFRGNKEACENWVAKRNML